MIELALTPLLPAAALPIRAPGFTAEALDAGTLLEMRAGAIGVLDGLLPMPPCTACDRADWRLIWTRPDARLLHHPTRDAELPAPLAAVRHDRRCAVADLSHARAFFRLSGPHVRDVLACGTPVDLRPRAFSSGRAVRTVCAGFPVLLDHRADHVLLMTDAPLAAALRDWLDAAARPSIQAR